MNNKKLFNISKWEIFIFTKKNIKQKLNSKFLNALVHRRSILLFATLLLVSPLTRADDFYSYISPTVTYTLYGSDISAPSIQELQQNIRAQQSAQFAKCTSQETYNCIEYIFTNVTPAPGYNYVNGIPVLQNMNVLTHYSSRGPAPQYLTNDFIRDDGTSLGAAANIICADPYGNVTTGAAPNFTTQCRYIQPKACPKDGNPINIGTAEKFEQEIDFSTSDGLLKVERNYINQFSGWAVDEPSYLLEIPAGSNAREPVLITNNMVSNSSPIITLTRYTLDPNNLQAKEKYSYIPVMYLVNTLSTRVVYLHLEREQYRFTGAGNTLTGEGPAGSKLTLIDLGPVAQGVARWKLIKANGDNYYFYSDGTLQRIEFLSGGSISYQYNGNQLLSKTDHTGRSLNYSYDTKGRVISITQPDGQQIVYSYGTDPKATDFALLKKITWPNGENISYSYNETGMMSNTTTNKALTGKFDSQNNRIGTYKYADNQAISTEGALGSFKRTFEYFYNYTSDTTGLGSQRLFYFNTTTPEGTKLLTSTNQPAGSGCAASTKTATYDSSGNKTTNTDFNGNKFEYAYDSTRGLETVRVEGLSAGNGTDYTPSNSSLPIGARKISTLWHSQYRKIIKIAEQKLITAYVYNGDQDPFTGQIANCSTSTLPFLCHKIIQATTDSNGSQGFNATLDNTLTQREWRYTYNARGQVLSVTRNSNATPDEIREYYETNSSTYHTGDLKRVTNSLGQHLDYLQYDPNGRVLSMTDINGITNSFTYDARGRLSTQTILNSTTSYEYDLNGNRTKINLPNNTALNFEFDLAKRITSIKNSFGDKTTFDYDVESNITASHIYDTSGVLKYQQTKVYDALSRVKQIVDNKNNTTTYLYDANGNSTGVQDAKLQNTSNTFDTLDQLKLTTDALNGQTNYGYDAAGRITTVTDPKNHTTTYNYNAFGDLISQVSPDTGTTNFVYDAAGNRTSMTDARGVVVNYTYDALNRLKTVSYPASTTENISFTYDSTANGSYGIGRLASVITNAARHDYEYNHLGLITKKYSLVGSVIATTQYAYDTAGNLTSIIYPSGRLVTYARDTAGRISGITTQQNLNASVQTILSGINYLPFGPANSYSYGNNLINTQSYDTDYRLNSIQIGAVLNRSYGFDAVENITSIVDGINSTKNQTFNYDALNRLTSATGTYGNLGYTYDAVGNRLTETKNSVTQNYTLDTNSNRLLTISGTTPRSFTYDLAGNRITGTSDAGAAQNFNYNNANRLSSVTSGSTTLGTYTYNALGQRVTKVANGNIQEWYHYDEAGNLIAVTDGSGNPQREYIYFNHQLVGFVNKTTTTIPVPNIVDYANQATITGAAALATNQTGYTSPTGFIKFTGEGQITWPATINTAATYTAAVRYAMTGSNRAVDVYVDNVKKTSITFTATTNLNTWSTKSVSLTLTTGAHTIAIKTKGQSAPNTDSLTLSTTATTTSTTQTQYYVHNDHHNTPQIVTNQAQQIVWAADYQPFGKINLTTNTIEIYSRFPGQFADSETSLYQNYFRDLDPSIGRYIESDPIGLEGGLNTYAYAEENPVRFIDPKGLKKWDWDGWGNTSICSYYDELAKKTCSKYYQEAAKICKGQNSIVNAVMTAGITQSWASGKTDASQSEIANQIRQNLINSDQTARALNNRGNSAPRGDYIDMYHNNAFQNAGINPVWYGGNLWPQGVWPNPVPYDPMGNSEYDPRNKILPSGDQCGCSK